MQIDKKLLKNVTLLYVEDDEMTLEEISYFLSRYVKKLIVAKNGEEGLALFKEHNPDMIISDIQMPKMNGLEMSRKVLEINPEIPIALTTAYSDSDYLVKAIELGIDKYVLKPINLSEILVIIQKSLNLQSIDKSHCEDYIQFLIDSTSSSMFIVNSETIEFVNKNLSTLLSQHNTEILNKDFNEYKDLFELINIDTHKNYVDYIIENPDNEYVVTFKNSKCKNLYNRKFKIKYRYFDETKKSIFVFTEIQVDRLSKIKTLSLELINNHNECKNNEAILKSLEEIISLSSEKR